jgi:hypothetical protein
MSDRHTTAWHANAYSYYILRSGACARAHSLDSDIKTCLANMTGTVGRQVMRALMSVLSTQAMIIIGLRPYASESPPMIGPNTNAATDAADATAAWAAAWATWSPL